MTMQRRNFHLTQDQIDRLNEMAKQRGVSAGELIRRFIDQGLARLGAPSDLGEGSDVEVLRHQISEIWKELVHLRTQHQENLHP